MDDTKIPAVLKREALCQWVCWRTEPRDGKPTKVPLDPDTGDYASVANPETWSDYATARAYSRESAAVEGIGFVFTADDPYVGVDLDDCRDPATDEVDDWAVRVLRQLESYTERSPSRTGFHVYVIGEVPAGGNRRDKLEMYDRNRYFTVTGDRVLGAPKTVEQRGEELRAIHEEYIATPEPDTTYVPPEERPDVSMTDEELVEKARNAANGDKFQALWTGDTSGYPSHSEADLALCSMLAFWVGGDGQRIEALFARSGLVRDKWRNRPDYRERTIRTPTRDCSTFYAPAGDD